jgi:uncharacterized membrane protein YfcA
MPSKRWRRVIAVVCVGLCIGGFMGAIQASMEGDQPMARWVFALGTLAGVMYLLLRGDANGAA